MRYLILLLGLLLAAPSFAGQGIIPSAIYYASGSSEPASGTVIIGSSTTSTVTSGVPNANQEWFFDTDLAASWSETATTTTVGTIEVYMQGWAGGNCKALITDSSGTLLTNGVSNVTAVDYEESPTWHVFTMGTPPTVTKSSNYRLAVVCDTDSAIQLPYNDTGTITFGYESGGTYTTPTSLTIPPDSASDTSTTLGGFRAKH